MPGTASPLSVDVARVIRVARGTRVVLDEDLARLYGVSTKRLNEAVSRNIRRFPGDFMFRLTASEENSLRSQFATSRSRHGGRRYPARAFTEQGIAMLSGVLRSPTAISVNVEIMRAFVLLRRLERDHSELRRRLDELERRFDVRLRVVFESGSVRKSSREVDEGCKSRMVHPGPTRARAAEWSRHLLRAFTATSLDLAAPLAYQRSTLASITTKVMTELASILIEAGVVRRDRVVVIRLGYRSATQLRSAPDGR